MIELNLNINLIALMHRERTQFKMMGEAWLAAGARAFGVFNTDGTPLIKVGENLPVLLNGSNDILRETITALDAMLGELRVAIDPTPEARLRLAADARLINRLFSLDSDLEHMAAELVDAQDQLLALYRLARSVNDQVDLHGTLEILAAEAAHLVKVDSAFLFLAPDQIAQHPPNHLAEDDIMDVFVQIQATGNEILTNETGPLPNTESLLVLSILIQGQMVAALGLVNKPGGFTSPDLKLGRAIAEKAGVHLERILLYEEMMQQARLRTELEMAAEIQMQLLPQRIPRIEGLDIYAGLVQASQVGGDFYDFAGQEDLVFTVGDVAGKGMSSALMMAMTRTVMHSRANGFPAPDPGAVLTASNVDLFEDYSQVSMFTTALVGRYNAADRTLDYANAGHSPVIYRQTNQSAHLLRASNVPMGILPDNLYHSKTITMEPGDIFIVATDGFNEARNGDGEFFGYERLLALVDQHSGESAQALATAMFDAINQFSAGHPQDDDQTIIVLKAV
jgi:phosphoserine phosphatase RsbU/P